MSTATTATTATPAEAAATIATIQPGKAWRCFPTPDSFGLVRLADGGGYEVECGWAVRESYEDDHRSTTYHPFADKSPRPWVGRRVVVATAAEAGELWIRIKTELSARRTLTIAGAETIGSVSRS